MEDVSAAEPTRTTFNILFVCTGNTCRSPMAEVLARRELQQRDWRHVVVGSAGVAAAAGAHASREAVVVARREGLDLGTHSSRQLTPELVEWADLILAMGPSHLFTVDQLGGEAKGALLTDFASGGEGEVLSVPDPFGGPEEAYEETLQSLKRLVSASLDRLAPILHP